MILDVDVVNTRAAVDGAHRAVVCRMVTANIPYAWRWEWRPWPRVFVVGSVMLLKTHART